MVETRVVGAENVCGGGGAVRSGDLLTIMQKMTSSFHSRGSTESK
jgi:hypothetical protein